MTHARPVRGIEDSGIGPMIWCRPQLGSLVRSPGFKAVPRGIAGLSHNLYNQ
jgi:hypothetical protein